MLCSSRKNDFRTEDIFVWEEPRTITRLNRPGDRSTSLLGTRLRKAYVAADPDSATRREVGHLASSVESLGRGGTCRAVGLAKADQFAAVFREARTSGSGGPTFNKGVTDAG